MTDEPRRLHGVSYPSIPTPVRDAEDTGDVSDELTAARVFVRTAFTPPLPESFAHWYVHLRQLTRSGADPETMVAIPRTILDQGYRFIHTTPSGHITLRTALRAFNQTHLLHPPSPTVPDTTSGADADPSAAGGRVELAAVFAALGIHAEFLPHPSTDGCTIRMHADQAAALVSHLLPPEGSPEGELTIALGLLEELTDPAPGGHLDLCALDHRGDCQMHSSGTYEGACAMPQAHAFLVRHGVRGTQ